MAPKKKVMQAKTERSLSEAAIAEVLIGECKMQKAQVTAWLDSLAGLAAKELQSTGKFTIPGVCRRARKPPQRHAKGYCSARRWLSRLTPPRRS